MKEKAIEDIEVKSDTGSISERILARERVEDRTVSVEPPSKKPKIDHSATKKYPVSDCSPIKKSQSSENQDPVLVFRTSAVEMKSENVSTTHRCLSCAKFQYSFACQPCGHLCLCDTCCNDFVKKQCPMCTSIVMWVQQIVTPCPLEWKLILIHRRRNLQNFLQLYVPIEEGTLRLVYQTCSGTGSGRITRHTSTGNIVVGNQENGMNWKLDKNTWHHVC